MSNSIAARFADTPVLVNPEASERVTHYLASTHTLLAAEIPEALTARASADGGDDFWGDDDLWYRPYCVSADGILQIPIMGVLLSGFPYQFGSWATGYEYIAAAYQRGLADTSVKGIALVIDSPGGEVAGNFDLVDMMYGQRDSKEKPVQAFAAEMACSAAYSIASAADKITVTRTGIVGSIGVVTSHVDYSEAISKAGYKITFIFAGAHKVDGNPYEPLPEAVRARVQARVDELYGIFVGIVARNRGITEEAVRNTEALTFMSKSAVDIGLADSVGPLIDSLAAFASEVNGNQTGGNITMTTTATSPTETAPALTAADVAAAAATAATAQKDRISAILSLPEAKTRGASAQNLALSTDLTVDQAKALLATLPETKPEASTEGNAFEAAMNSGENPNITAGGGADKPKMTDSDKILADFKAAGGNLDKAHPAR